ncbi:unnamed protein product, partial [Discosporangium mesarthrocarpum]
VCLGGIAVIAIVLICISQARSHSLEQQIQTGLSEEEEDPDWGPDITSVTVFATSKHTNAQLAMVNPDAVGDIDALTDALVLEHCSSHDEPSIFPEIDACPISGAGTVVVDTHRKKQKILGFGGAFTDAATINLYKLPPFVRAKVMDAYFGPSGIEYTMGRIPMGSCDFSVEQYSFDDHSGDYKLKDFDDDITRETLQRIPMIREALLREPKLNLFTSPWSPPAWMKTPVNGVQSMIGSAQPSGLLDDPNVKQAWALYFSKFINAYARYGIDLWGLTVQNEPENPGPWEACVYNASTEASFIRDYLGPLMRRDHPKLKLMSFDHNKDHLPFWTQTMMEDPEVAQYVDGMAFHWYYHGDERKMDGSYGWTNIKRAYNLLDDEDKFLLSSESCNCPNVDHTMDGSWARAEHMTHDVIADLNNMAVGWVDWNLLLDYDGGPNHAGNLCDSPVYCLKDHSDVVFQPMFYFMGHITKFAKPGSTRLFSSIVGDYQKLGQRPTGALPGFEATTYGCEGSARQSWEISSDGKIILADVFGSVYETFIPLCLSRSVSENTNAVTLVTCSSPEAGKFIYNSFSGQVILDLEASFPPTPRPTTAPRPPPATPSPSLATPPPTAAPTSASTGPIDAIKWSEYSSWNWPDSSLGGGGEWGHQHEVSSKGPCLSTRDEDSEEDGEVLTLRSCDSSGKAGQAWMLPGLGGGPGEVVSLTSGRCMTAGWPFFTGVAFKLTGETKHRYGKHKYAVVVLNEAEEVSRFVLSLPKHKTKVAAEAPPRSIQTYIL